ncbi:Ribose-phosphate pyrophosphokinase [Sedimentisphaera cyanobacteriorum]|uniref:Ribose-phosphate pyrophosphokinase n=1 Tax=Sedimentisphaera cyanobacteriorum TaxID=1940790 RepID=A0A1Q2HMY8_9BACT|nr:ribose-phosphate pyrophosphokinase [Sedimentisphaera cyanobacteriorum]AQQ08624.1 Ribose-phosphate pyrophosphokinase [Sedimentisphaera cyanobacteriorum]
MFLNESVKVFGGSANPELVKKICGYLGVTPGGAAIRRFPDGEKFVKIDDNVRGKDCFIVQSTCTPVDGNLMELLIMIDTLKRASANRITAVIPYYGYARQDRKDDGRVPITAKLVANLLTAAGATRVLGIDLHARQLEGFFDIPVDHLMAEPVMVKYLRDKKIQKPVIVSPDVGNVKTASRYVSHIRADLAIVHKKRLNGKDVHSENIIGSVEGKNVVMVDDMISTAGTICSAAKLVKKMGANKVIAGATHGLFCGPAVERIQESYIDEIFVTDTIPLRDDVRNGINVTVLSVAELLGESIKRVHRNESISSLLLS